MLGGVREDYCITPDGQAISGVLGGNAVYAAVGARLWSESVAIISRVGSNYPHKCLESVEHEGISTAGVRILDQPLDTRTFYAYLSLEERVDINPSHHYHKLGLSLPKALLGYSSSTEGQDQRNQLNPLTVRTTDIPAQLLHGVVGAHLSPAEFLSHVTLPKYLKDHKIEVVTLDPSIRYMKQDFQLELPMILQGLQAFLPSLYEASSFLPHMKDQVWEMAEFFHSLGPPIIVIKAGASGQYLLDSQNKRRWHIPAYPSHPRDVTGAGDAFCGAFLVGLIDTGDALEAVLRGNVSASFVVEGSGALYALDASPSLVVARLDNLRNMVREE
jgi:sugar/nucleoside kinase (ribokinase family)